MGTSSADASHTATTTSIRRSAWACRLAGVLLVAGSCAASLAILPITAQAQRLGTEGPLRTAAALSGRSSTPLSAASAFCARLSISKISSAVGTPELFLLEAVPKGTELECIFFTKKIGAVLDEIIISTQPGIPASQATLANVEAKLRAESPKGVTLKITVLPTLGAAALSWTYAKPVNGGQLVGIADDVANSKKLATGYGAVVGGAAKTFGTGASHLSVLEKLIALDMAA
jgi:hypothetical protein